MAEGLWLEDFDALVAVLRDELEERRVVFSSWGPREDGGMLPMVLAGVLYVADYSPQFIIDASLAFTHWHPLVRAALGEGVWEGDTLMFGLGRELCTVVRLAPERVAALDLGGLGDVGGEA